MSKTVTINVKELIGQLKPGDYIDAFGDGDFLGIGRIIDIYYSEYSQRGIVIILFFRNAMRKGRLGGDVIQVAPDNTAGVENWKVIKKDEAMRHKETFLENARQEAELLAA